MSSYRAEYIWIDGSEPTQFVRSKTKVVPKGDSPSIWGFDGSSTNQAVGSDSDCVLNPVFTCSDPIRDENDNKSEDYILQKNKKTKVLNIGPGGEINNLITNNFEDIFSIDIDQQRNPNQVIDLCDDNFT